MDVTRTNFEDVFPHVQQAIQESDFVALDTEMTGLLVDSSLRNASADDFPNRYEKIRAAGVSFLVVQFGLATFQWAQDRLLCKPFNFWLWPRSYGKLDRTFLVQASSLTFLAENNFDFNKLVKDGISFLSLDDEDEIRAKGVATEAPRDPVVIKKEEDKAYVQKLFDKVDAWIACPDAESTLSLDPANGFHRRLCYQEVGARYPHLYMFKKDPEDGGQPHIVVERMTGEEKEERECKDQEEKKSKMEAELAKAVGFRRVLDELVSTKKLVVGHNMIMDLASVFDQLLRSLPETIEEFCHDVHSFFPRIVDTKYMASKTNLLTDLCPSTTLGRLYASVCKEPFDAPKIEIAQPFNRYDTKEWAHEAGFDAYMTGFVFARLVHYIRSRQEMDAPAAFSCEWTGLHPYIDRIFFMRSSLALHLSGPNNADQRPVFHLANLNASIRTSDIVQWFEAAVGQVQIEWLDDTSALVVAEDKTRARDPMGASVMGNLPSFVVLTEYRTWLKMKTKEMTMGHSGKRKRI